MGITTTCRAGLSIYFVGDLKNPSSMTVEERLTAFARRCIGSMESQLLGQRTWCADGSVVLLVPEPDIRDGDGVAREVA